MTDKPPTPTINPRFIIQVPFRDSRTKKVNFVPVLNHDGYIDYAHQVGLISTRTEIIEQRVEETPSGTDELGRPKVDRTRWCTVRVTVEVESPRGKISAQGIASVCDRDKWASRQLGMEVAVAETRAEKRAIAKACNITEAVINPTGENPTRETVDMPIQRADIEEPEEIPKDVRTTPPPQLPQGSETGEFDFS
jgi:hypothetical protein